MLSKILYDLVGYNKMNDSSKIEGYDFIRAISTLMVVCFHFSRSYSQYNISGFCNYINVFPNGDWGSVAVSMFFMLSGATLWCKYSSGIVVSEFYKKRWISIYPMFYLAWISSNIMKVCQTGNVLWGGAIYKIILTVLGLDGYLLYLGNNYYILGEWFLGAIIILYTVFPLIRLAFYKKIKIVTIVILTLYIANICFNVFIINDFRNIITCLLSFWIGMLYEKYRLEIGKEIVVISATVCIIIILIPINISNIYLTNVLSLSVFIVLMKVADIAMKGSWFAYCINSISKYSYAIYLVHHIIISTIMKRFSNIKFSVINGFGLLLALFIIIYFVAYLLYRINKINIRVVSNFICGGKNKK
jgi:peptidoglycan/LPS O-acetylase OafA/YrhL